MSRARVQLVITVLAAALLAAAPCAAFPVHSVLLLGIRQHRATHSEQQQVVQTEDQIRAALLGADASALDRILADDFLGISANGTLSDKQQYLRRIGQKEHQFSRIDVTDRKVRVQPGSAIVVTTADVVGKLDGTPIRGVYRYTRVYSRTTDGGWKLRNFEATRVAGVALDEMHHGVPIPKTR